MEKMSKEQIIEIAKEILASGDVIAKHGTSIANAKSIMETGFDFHRTSYVMHTSDSITDLCGYGWKENEKGNAASIIMEVPREFFKMMLGYDDSLYDAWMASLNEEDKDCLLRSVTDYNMSNQEQDNESKGTFSNSFLAPMFIGHVPREFVKGMFVFCDNTNYLSFRENLEEALEHLTFFENPNYFSKLSPEEKSIFVANIREKIFPSQGAPGVGK